METDTKEGSRTPFWTPHPCPVDKECLHSSWPASRCTARRLRLNDPADAAGSLASEHTSRVLQKRKRGVRNECVRASPRAPRVRGPSPARAEAERFLESAMHNWVRIPGNRTNVPRATAELSSTANHPLYAVDRSSLQLNAFSALLETHVYHPWFVGIRGSNL
jgi:hypothetical protein